jgi:agmatinase
LTAVATTDRLCAMHGFDPDAAAVPGSGIFGLTSRFEDAACVLVPVPFDATTSYRDGTRNGPAAILAASHQVDLFDPTTGRPYERGIVMLDADPRIEALSANARALALPILAKGGAVAGDETALRAVETAQREVNAIVAESTARILRAGKLPGIVGGDHSVPLGAIAAAAAHHGGLGILHIDAHADLRVAFEGFRYSHASIMDNVLEEVPSIERLVQLGIRDFGHAEFDRIHASDGRIVTWFDVEWQRRKFAGEPLAKLIGELIAPLPAQVWISVDIDGLDPALCPNTGTPVPGGLGFVETCLVLEGLARSGRRIVGFDLVEVAPGADGDEWDANVGARLLYKLCGFALSTN